MLFKGRLQLFHSQLDKLKFTSLKGHKLFKKSITTSFPGSSLLFPCNRKKREDPGNKLSVSLLQRANRLEMSALKRSTVANLRYQLN